MADKFYLTSFDSNELSLLLRGIIKEELQSINSKSSSSDVITLDEFCNEFKLAKQTIYRKASSGSIPHFKIGKRLLFSRKKIMEWISQGKRGCW